MAKSALDSPQNDTLVVFSVILRQDWSSFQNEVSVECYNQLDRLN